MSAIGLIKILKITKAGNILVAGPSTVFGMNKLIKLLSKYNLDKIFVDGAFSKLAFSAISDAIIYSIGASYSYNLDKIVRDSVLRVKILSLPKIDWVKKLNKYNDIVLIDNLGTIKKLATDSTIALGKNII